jgi:hypothetical protein
VYLDKKSLNTLFYDILLNVTICTVIVLKPADFI